MCNEESMWEAVYGVFEETSVCYPLNTNLNVLHLILGQSIWPEGRMCNSLDKGHWAEIGFNPDFSFVL